MAEILNTLGGAAGRQSERLMATLEQQAGRTVGRMESFAGKMMNRAGKRLAQFDRLAPGAQDALLGGIAWAGVKRGAMYGAAGGAAMAGLGQAQSGQFDARGIIGGGLKGAMLGGALGAPVNLGYELMRGPGRSRFASAVDRAANVAAGKAARARAETSAAYANRRSGWQNRSVSNVGFHGTGGYSPAEAKARMQGYHIKGDGGASTWKALPSSILDRGQSGYRG